MRCCNKLSFQFYVEQVITWRLVPSLCSVTRKLALASAIFLWASSSSHSQDFWENNSLLDLYIGSSRSTIARTLQNGGYELSDGTYVDFKNWYMPKYPDITVMFLKQVSENFGVIWGFSTGEKASKYTIDPAFQFGFAYQYAPFEDALISIRATYPLRGKFREKTCLADYGDIGGVQLVNCRLAAGLLPPMDTLDYLVNLRGEIDARIYINFSLRF